jgi:mycoredoxin
LKSQLDREGIAYTVVDIEHDDAAADFVMSVNGGNQTVPTVLFDDGSTMTNPTIIDIRQHLATAAVAPGDGRTT